MQSSLDLQRRTGSGRVKSTRKWRWLPFLLAPAIAAAFLLWLNYGREIAELRARITDRATIVSLATGKLEYAEAGSGAPVLVVHGSGGGFDQGLEMAAPLAGAGYRLIAPSRFGYLRSDFPDGASPELQADAFAALLDQLDIRRIFVIGGAAGALSAMQFAIRHPDRCRGLVLNVPAVYSPTRKPGTSSFEGPVQVWAVRTILNSDFLFWLAITLAPETMTRVILATEPAVVRAQPSQEQQRVRAILRHILPVSERTEGLMLDMRTAGNPEQYPLDKIRCPVFAVSARDDLYGTADSAAYTAAHVPDGRAVIYDTGGHILAGHDAEAWQEVGAFFAAVEAKTR